MRRAEVRGDPEPGLGLDRYNTDFSAVVEAKMARFGQAIGAQNSQARLQQCRVLERHRYPEMRNLPSFQRHLRGTAAEQANSEWRRWFLNLQQGVSIFQAIIAKKGWETGDVIPGLSRGQTRSLMQVQQPPSVWQGTGDEWRTDPDMALLAISEHMRRMAQRRDPRRIVSDEARQRIIQSRLAASNEAGEVVDVFSNSLVRVAANGRSFFWVYTAENQALPVKDRTGLWFGKQYANQQYRLDYDPTINRHALVSI